MSLSTLLLGFVLAVPASGGDLPAIPVLAPAGQSSPGVHRLAFDAANYEALRRVGTFRLEDLPLSTGAAVSVLLERIDVFSDDAQLVAADGDARRPLARPDVQTFIGEVEGEVGSRAFLAVSPMGTSGYLIRGEGTSIISSGPGGLMPTVIYDTFGPLAADVNIVIPPCAGAILPEGVAPTPANTGAGYVPRAGECRVIRLALECDTEFTQNGFGGNQTAASVYAATLAGAMTEIYRRDLNAGFQVSFLRLWTGADPYTAPTSSPQLAQFRDYWNANMAFVQRDLAHMLSPRGLGGGVAYRPGLCSSSGGYGLSGNLNSFFPYPLVNNSGQNWDIMVASHEIGHNFNSGHTHDPDSYNPPIDGCGNGYLEPPLPADCTAANLNIGTIMSYCHVCSGGMTNIRLEFGPRPIAVMRAYLDPRTNCGLTPSITILFQPQSAQLCEGEPVTLTVGPIGVGTRTYQWRRNGTPIPGATGTAHAFVAAPATAGAYDVVVSATCLAVTSQTATVSLRVPCGCDPDLDQDGNVDQGDLGYLINVVGGGTNTTGIDPDFNGDGAVDQGDVDALLTVIAGGECP